MIFLLTLVLFVPGFVGMRKYRRVRHVEAAHYPEIDPVVFNEWKRLELASLRALLWSSFGGIGYLYTVWHFGFWIVAGHLIVWEIGLVSCFVAPPIGMIWAAVLGTRAKHMARQHGISLETFSWE
jgi:hypothetical protein